MSKVLIVDDAAFMRAMLRKILTEAGHECLEAGTGVEALAVYAEQRPDLVTMDITMPDMDGIEALRELRRLDPRARVVMCSAMGQETLVLDAIRAGAADFVVKPFKADRVTSAVAKALSRAAV